MKDVCDLKKTRVVGLFIHAVWGENVGVRKAVKFAAVDDCTTTVNVSYRSSQERLNTLRCCIGWRSTRIIAEIEAEESSPEQLL